MMSTTHQDQDLETLSALFDGELQGDAARFAIRRLGHDPRWQQAFGDWQLVGDALRGQASIAAPRGFADRVAMLVAAEPVGGVAAMAAAAVTVASASPGGMQPASSASAAIARRRWIGGAALAASVAMVAMLVARPFSQEPATNPDSTTSAPTELVAVPAPAPDEARADVGSPMNGTAMQVAAASIAVAAVPRNAAERRSRGQSQRAALRAPRRQLSTPAIANAVSARALSINEPAPPSTTTPSGVNPSSVSPFHPQHAEVVSRPWPRAVLPAATGAGAFTASYGSSGTAGSPSFYPFEPSLPGATGTAPAPADGDEVRP